MDDEYLHGLFDEKAQLKEKHAQLRGEIQALEEQKRLVWQEIKDVNAEIRKQENFDADSLEAERERLSNFRAWVDPNALDTYNPDWPSLEHPGYKKEVDNVLKELSDGKELSENQDNLLDWYLEQNL